MYSPKIDARARFSADDWGLSPAVNEAIVELARDGLLRQVSLFANLPYLHHGLDALLESGVELAAHLNFTLGRPIAPGVDSLTDAAGRFHSFGWFLLRGSLGLIHPAQVRREALAQLGILTAACPIECLNGHQHAHLLPWMAEPLASAAREHGLRRVRLMCDPGHLPSRVAARWSSRAWRAAWPGLEPDATHYLFPTGPWSARALAEKIEKAGGRALLIHPASRDDFDSVEFADALRAARVSEFKSLKELVP